MAAGVASGRAGLLLTRVVGLGLMLSGCSASPASDQLVSADGTQHPRRIVSMNPCVDSILHLVADDRQIAGVSHYSQDPRATSVPISWARQFPAVGNDAEDVVAMRPDLVIAGPHVAPQTVAALKRLGVPLVQLGVPASVAESEKQIDRVAQMVGQPERGRALNARINGSLAMVRRIGQASDTRTPPSALIWQDGGLVPGPGTLADELLRQAGFRSASTALGLSTWDVLSLEDLLWAPPDIVMTGLPGMRTDGVSGGGRLSTHPAMRKAAHKIMIADFPSRLVHCGGPMIVDTIDRLSQIRREWNGRRRS